jgi:predicted ATP-dependent Lon-type protease
VVVYREKTAIAGFQWQNIFVQLIRHLCSALLKLFHPDGHYSKTKIEVVLLM